MRTAGGGARSACCARVREHACSSCPTPSLSLIRLRIRTGGCRDVPHLVRNHHRRDRRRRCAAHLAGRARLQHGERQPAGDAGHRCAAGGILSTRVVPLRACASPFSSVESNSPHPTIFTPARRLSSRAHALSPRAVVLMLFDGFYINLNNIPAWCQWVHWFSFLSYGVKAGAANQFRGLVFTCTPDEAVLGCIKTVRALLLGSRRPASGALSASARSVAVRPWPQLARAELMPVRPSARPSRAAGRRVPDSARLLRGGRVGKRRLPRHLLRGKQSHELHGAEGRGDADNTDRGAQPDSNAPAMMQLAFFPSENGEVDMDLLRLHSPASCPQSLRFLYTGMSLRELLSS